ncbi:hypothetical protein A6035_14950 [Dietzia lutea]|uniref:Uncharacterized protein n=1 Tax=Dietzia lutea TaxID=546160 RepID=A0A2S1RAG8_9ACTN|nr:hypothetical protein A6035_14950 [Dietzia lutea]
MWPATLELRTQRCLSTRQCQCCHWDTGRHRPPDTPRRDPSASHSPPVISPAPASDDIDDIDVFDVVNAAQWINLEDGTSAEAPEAVTDANAARDAVGLGELEPGVYASVGACLDSSLNLLSMDYDAPIFVPGGVGSVGQAIDLGSSALEMEGGSSMLMDFGTAMVGS